MINILLFLFAALQLGHRQALRSSWMGALLAQWLRGLNAAHAATTGARAARSALALAVLAGAGLAQAVTVNMTSGSTFTVPSGIYQITVTISGGAGGAGSHNAGNAGNGGAMASYTAVLNVIPGDVLTGVLGIGGGAGAFNAACNGGGTAGSGDPSGGSGGNAGCVGASGGGGGGGGSSSLARAGVTLLLAGGAGGGGGGSGSVTATAGGPVSTGMTTAASCASTINGGTGATPGGVDGGGGGGGGGGFVSGNGGASGADFSLAATGGGAGTSCSSTQASLFVSGPTGSAAGGGGLAGSPGSSGASGAIAIAYTIAAGTFWDGPAANGTTVEGGTATWDAVANNWTQSGGSPNGPWAGGTSVATFAGTAGTVTVSGTQSIGGLTFNTTGYTLNGGTLTGAAPTNTLTADTGISATVGSILAGGNAFDKAGAGAVTLTGPNSYTGVTSVTTGTLQIGNGSNVGNLGAGAVSIASGATLAYKRSDSNLILGSVHSGAGTIAFLGTGIINQSSFRLTGNNSGFTGPMTATLSRIWVTSPANLGAGGITVNTGASLYVAGPGTYPNNITVGGTGWLETTPAIGAIRSDFNGVIFSGNVALTADTLIGGYTGATNTDLGTYSGIISGAFGLSTKGASAGTLTLTGANSYTGTTSVITSTLQVGNGGTTGNLGAGAVSIASGATLAYKRSDSNLILGSVHSGAGTLAFLGTGTISQSSYQLTGNNSGFTGPMTATLSRIWAASPAALGAGNITLNNGAGMYVAGPGTYPNNITVGGTGWSEVAGVIGAIRSDFNGAIFSGNVALTADTLIGGYTGATNTDLGTYSGIISGAFGLSIKGASTGALTLTGANSYTGPTTVIAGKLLVNGNQLGAAGAVTVQTGATLGGSGTLGGVVTVNSGGILSPGNSPGTLTMSGLSLPAGSNLNMELGQANTVAGTYNDLVQDNGNLTLGGGTLNVSVPTTPAGGSFTPGTYRLINYTGTLTNSGGLVIGTVPAGFTAAQMVIDTNTAGQVNLIVLNANATYWDVSPPNNSVVDGGTGTWSPAGTGSPLSWTDSGGVSNTQWTAGGTAIFAGTAGTVTVVGAPSIGGLTFNTTGYVLSGGTLTGAAATNALTAGAGISATVGSVLAGTNAFAKVGAGTITLTADNTYTGATTVTAGTLALQGLYQSPSYAIASGAVLELYRATATDYGVATTFSGAGTLRKTGVGYFFWGPVATTFALGAGSLIDVQVGTFVAGSFANENWTGNLSSLSLASGTFFQTSEAAVRVDALNGAGTVKSGYQTATYPNSGLTVGVNGGSGTFSGVIQDYPAGGVTAAAKSLTKLGSGTQTLSGLNTYSGITAVSGGVLQLGVNSALPSGSVTTVAAGATLNVNGMTQSLPNVTSAGTVALGSGGNLTLTSGASSIGAITGSGTITVGTGATLTMTAALVNSGVNIVLAGGTLNLGVFTHSIGALSVTAASTLDFASAGNAQLTTTSLNPAFALAVTNWTLNVDHFYATAVTGAPAQDTRNVAPLNNITLTGATAAQTAWLSATNEITTALPGTYWDGPATNSTTVEGGNGTWDATTSNWTQSTGTPNGLWAGGTSTATFAGTAGTVTVSGTQSIGGLTFNTSGYTLSGGTLLGAAATNTLTAGAGISATVGSVLAGTNAFAKAGAGTVTLSGINTYTGATTVSGGTLILSSSNYIGYAGGPININNGATLQITQTGGAQRYDFGSQAYNFDATGGGTIAGVAGLNWVAMGSWNFNTAGGAKDTVSGLINLNGSNNIALNVALGSDPSTDLNFAAVIYNGAGALTKTGTGRATLNGANTYTSSTTVSGGVLQLGIDSALPSTSVTTVAAGAMLDVNGKTQSLPRVISAGTVALGSGGNLTLTSGASSIGAITGSGTITVGTGATLTLTAALVNTGVNIVLAGGTLNLGVFTHSMGVLSVTAASTLDFASAGNAQITATSFNPAFALAVTNWTLNADHFYATAVTGNPVRGKSNISPLTNITMTGATASQTTWVSTNEISTMVPLTVTKTFSPPSITAGGTSTLSVTVTNPNSYTLSNLAFTDTYPAGLVNATTPAATISCTTTPASRTVTATAGGNTLAVTARTIPAGGGSCTATVKVTSAAVGSYVNTLPIGAITTTSGGDSTSTAPASATLTVTPPVVTGSVFLDNGAGGGTANDGIRNGTEGPQSGVTVTLGNCSGTTYSTAITDGTGNYTLAVPLGTATGAPLCVAQTNQSGRTSTGASIGSTALPNGVVTAASGTNYTYNRAVTPDTIAFAFNGTGHAGLNFGDVDNSSFGASGAKSSQPGNSVSFPHTFTANTAGSVSFSVASSVSSPALAGWSERIFADPGCTGALQAGAAVLYPPSVATLVTAGQQVCVIVQEMIPGTAQNNYSNAARIQANLTLSNANPALTATYTLNDVTSVSSSALDLKKQVRNFTQGAGFGVNNLAKSGETLEYSIIYTNNGASPITNLVINDTTPAYTTFVSALDGTRPASLSACQKNTPANAQPAAAVGCSAPQAVGGTGAISFQFTGQLNPGGTGNVLFQVKVD